MFLLSPLVPLQLAEKKAPCQAAGLRSHMEQSADCSAQQSPPQTPAGQEAHPTKILCLSGSGFREVEPLS